MVSSERKVEAVTLPPGRARLATRPTLTGSPTPTTTTGMVMVAFLAARAAGVPQAASSTSTLPRTRSAASSGNRSGFPSAQRYSNATCRPSRWPRSRSPSRKGSRDGSEAGEKGDRIPIRDVLRGGAAAAVARPSPGGPLHAPLAELRTPTVASRIMRSTAPYPIVRPPAPGTRTPILVSVPHYGTEPLPPVTREDYWEPRFETFAYGFADTF